MFTQLRGKLLPFKLSCKVSAVCPNRRSPPRGQHFQNPVSKPHVIVRWNEPPRSTVGDGVAYTSDIECHRGQPVSCRPPRRPCQSPQRHREYHDQGKYTDPPHHMQRANHLRYMHPARQRADLARGFWPALPVVLAAPSPRPTSASGASSPMTTRVASGQAFTICGIASRTNSRRPFRGVSLPTDRRIFRPASPCLSRYSAAREGSSPSGIDTPGCRTTIFSRSIPFCTARRAVLRLLTKQRSHWRRNGNHSIRYNGWRTTRSRPWA